MKTIINTTILLLSLLLLTACKQEESLENKKSGTHSITVNQNAPVSLLDHYMAIKNALVQSDLDAAKNGAKKMKTINSQEEILEILTAITTANDLKETRLYFSKLTSVIGESLPQEKTSGTLYKQFCPMAFNNTGGYWFSTEEEIRNPYYGDQMLTCGRVVEEFNE